MIKRVLTFIEIMISWIAVFILQKPLFMAIYHDKLPQGTTFSGWLDVMAHGLTLDISMAGYLMIIPALLLIASVWVRQQIVSRILAVYFVLSSLLVSAAFVVNAGLYRHWGFPLDSTPVFYFLSSPKDAMASMTGEIVWGGILSVLILSAAISALLLTVSLRVRHSGFLDPHRGGNRLVTTVVLSVLTLLLIIPIRGGVTVSTANTGKVYFSDSAFMNHSAVNPMFSFMESVSHQENFKEQYRYMPAEVADSLFCRLTDTRSDSTTSLLNTQRPDIYIIIMESFSMKLWETDAVPHLKTIAKDGLMFTRFYANSFRTDRGLVAILSGFPAQPTMSLMKYPKKTAHLPSIARHLREAGYATKYYYGGDADFTNMRSYLVSQGIGDIVSDMSFPVKDRMSKWGVPDDKLFERLKADLKDAGTETPMLRIIQTSSSHEPFDVPYSRLTDERLNAFAFTDECIGDFMSSLKASPLWDNSLVILLPDHQGCWPIGISNEDLGHYHIPMIWTGGALAKGGEVSTIGSQQDLAATLLGQMNISHDDMLFSKDMLNPAVPHFAFFTVNDLFGMITEENSLIFDNKAKHPVLDDGKTEGANIEPGKAYLQKLYDIIGDL